MCRRRRAYLHPLVCTYVSRHEGLSMWDFARSAADADMEMRAVASVTNDTLVLLCVWESVGAFFTHLWTRRIGASGPSMSFCTFSQAAFAAGSTEARRWQPIKRFDFPRQHFLVHTKVTAQICID